MQFWLDFGPVLVKMHACQYKKKESSYSSPLFMFRCHALLLSKIPVVAGNDFG
jgi:hypothetical protein